MEKQKRKILKAEQGVELIEDCTTGRFYMHLDGYSIFTNGIPKEYKNFIVKSYNNLVNIRKSENANNS